MKICLVTNLYKPHSTGGADIYVKWLAEALIHNGHQVFVVTTCPPRQAFPGAIRETIDGVSVYRFYPLNIYWGYLAQRKPLLLKPFWHSIELWNPHVYFVFKNILVKEMPDIVHINNMGGLSNAIFWASKGAGRRTVYTLHDFLSICPKSILLRSNLDICDKPRLLCKLHQRIKRWNLDNTIDVFVSPSHFLLEMHHTLKLVENSRCVVVPQGVEVTDEEIERIKRMRGTYDSGNRINILYIGRAEALKGMSVLVRAFEEADREDLHLHIAGSGDYLDRLQRELGQYNNVSFYGWVSGSAKEALFLKSDACILPSICYDNAPLVVLEAYKYGLPVIGSKIGGIPEMIRETKTGFLFEPGDESGLASILRDVSKEGLRGMANECQQTAITYSMRNHLERLTTIYTDLAGRDQEKTQMAARTRWRHVSRQNGNGSSLAVQK